jgi:hypothetical protein
MIFGSSDLTAMNHMQKPAVCLHKHLRGYLRDAGNVLSGFAFTKGT